MAPKYNLHWIFIVGCVRLTKGYYSNYVRHLLSFHIYMTRQELNIESMKKSSPPDGCHVENFNKAPDRRG